MEFGNQKIQKKFRPHFGIGRISDERTFTLKSCLESGFFKGKPENFIKYKYDHPYNLCFPDNILLTIHFDLIQLPSSIFHHINKIANQILVIRDKDEKLKFILIAQIMKRHFSEHGSRNINPKIPG